MNWSQGFKAVSHGLQLVAERQAKREDQDWQVMKAENLARIQHQSALDLEEVRAENNRQEGQTRSREARIEGERTRKAQVSMNRDDNSTALERTKMAEVGADRRLREQVDKNDARELSELRRHRTSTLQNFRTQYSKAVADYNEAKASGMSDEKDLGELRANIEYLTNEMQDFDAQSKESLAVAGDPWAKAQLRDGPPPGAAAKGGAPAAGGAAVPKVKPYQPAQKPGAATTAAPARTLQQVEAEMARLKPMADKYGVDTDTPEIYSAFSQMTSLENEAKRLRSFAWREQNAATRAADRNLIPSGY